MRYLGTAFALLLGVFLAAPAAAQVGGDELDLHDGQVFGKWIEEGHVVLDLFSTSGGQVVEVVCPLAQPGVLLAEACDMIEIGDAAPMWQCLAPDPASSFPTLHRLGAVTLGRHENWFAILNGEVTDKRIIGDHVLLDLSDGFEARILQVLCPMDQPGDLLAAACDMIEIGDVAPLWDGLAPDQASDHPTLLRLTSVTIGPPIPVEIFADGFEGGDMLAWSSSSP